MNDDLRDLFSGPRSDIQMEAARFAHETEPAAANLPTHWILLVSDEDCLMLKQIGIKPFTDCK